MDIRRIVRDRLTNPPPNSFGRSYMDLLYVKVPVPASKLAKAAGVPTRTVYDFLQGRSINLDALCRILDALQLRIVPAEQIEPPKPSPLTRVLIGKSNAPIKPKANDKG